MGDARFPRDFLWGAATSAHQVEGDNTNSDWWDWERAPGTPCREPSLAACDHYNRFPEDIALLASLGLNTYRFSVEWARIEPREGVFDDAAIDHYRAVVATAREHAVEPMVTLHHFTLPRWVAAAGGWTSPEMPARFERYVRRVVAALGDSVRWYCTINEPATVATGGYVGGWGFPPGGVHVAAWRRAIDGIIEGHRRAVRAIREVAPSAKVGLAVFSCERAGNEGGRPARDFEYRMNEAVYFDAMADDDFVGVQTYTRFQLYRPRIVAPLTRLALAIGPLENIVVPRVLGAKTAAKGTLAPAGSRVTQVGWEFRPEALAAVVRRLSRTFPDKDLVVTEHGVATLDDTERVEFIERGLAGLHAAMADGAKVRGYIHWSLLDNFEWATGYHANFGLVAVDRATQERIVRPSARRLGEIARSGVLATGTDER